MPEIGLCPPGSILPQCISAFKSVRTGVIFLDGPVQVEVIEADKQPKNLILGVSIVSWLWFFALIYACMVSWTLNNNVAVRKNLGFDGPAHPLVSFLSILGIFIFGPLVYFLALILPIMHKIFKTKNGRTWLQGLKDTPDTKPSMALAKALPVIGGPKNIAPQPAPFTPLSF